MIKMNNTHSIATFAGGCFWCTEAVLKRVTGVLSVVPGYTGGHIKNPCYREVCSGRTGHAEAVQITFDPSLVVFEYLLQIFFATHDPTALNRQGHDIGTQYRSGVFYHDETQRNTTLEYIRQLEENYVFSLPIVTEITPFEVFYQAEKEHFNYFDLNTEQPYCQYVIVPKIEKLNRLVGEKRKRGEESNS